jgi:hypothetical protein
MPSRALQKVGFDFSGKERIGGVSSLTALFGGP